MKALEQTLSWIGLFAHYAPVVILAGVFGWLVGASNLISDDHMLVSVIAPTVAGMSVLGVVTLAALLSFVSSPASFRRAETRADRRWRADSIPDEHGIVTVQHAAFGD